MKIIKAFSRKGGDRWVQLDRSMGLLKTQLSVQGPGPSRSGLHAGFVNSHNRGSEPKSFEAFAIDPGSTTSNLTAIFILLPWAFCLPGFSLRIAYFQGHLRRDRSQDTSA